MNFKPSGKNVYIAVSDNYAVRIRAFTKPSAVVKAAFIFKENVKGWQPSDGGFVEKANNKNVRKYISEHTDLKWHNDGKVIDV